MKLTALAFAGVFALAAGAAAADCGPNPNPKAKAAEHQAPCAQTAANLDTAGIPHDAMLCKTGSSDKNSRSSTSRSTTTT